jgi:hypothetical protein
MKLGMYWLRSWSSVGGSSGLRGWPVFAMVSEDCPSIVFTVVVVRVESWS